MLDVSIQVRQSNKSWENTPKTFQSFENWGEISEFAYRLSLKEDSEIRIEHGGNGNYYNPTFAPNFLGL